MTKREDNKGASGCNISVADNGGFMATAHGTCEQKVVAFTTFDELQTWLSANLSGNRQVKRGKK